MKIRLTQQIVLLVLVSVLAAAAAIVLTASQSVSTEMTREQRRQTERIIHGLVDALRPTADGGAAHSSDDSSPVLMTDLASLKNEDLDASARLGGGAATIFALDPVSNTFVRRLTSIKNEQGKRAIGTMLAADSPAQSFVQAGETYRGPTQLFGHRYYAIYQPIFDADHHVNGIVFAGSPMDDLYYAGYNNIMWQLTVVTAIIAVLIGAAVVTVSHRMFKPLRRIARRVEALTAGDTAAPVPGMERIDEIGLIAKAIERFRDATVTGQELRDEQDRTRRSAEAERTAREAAARDDLKRSEVAVAELGAGLDHLSRGNLVHVLSTPLYPQAEKLRIDLNQATSSLRDTMSRVAEVAETIGRGTIEIAAATDDLATRTQQQAGGLREASATLDDITLAATSTADNASEATAIVAGTKSFTEDGEAIMRDAVLAMAKIERSSQEISQIIGLIDEIAFQTNLLALNAGVEAARAGESGRGFAVVAAEVGTLAHRSAEAAKQIKNLISTSASEVGIGVGLVARTGTSLALIKGKVIELGTIVESIARNARKQSVGLREVNTVVSAMDTITNQNAAMVRDSSAASHALRDDSEALSALIGRFQIDGSRAQTPKAGSRFSAPVQTRRSA